MHRNGSNRATWLVLGCLGMMPLIGCDAGPAEKVGAKVDAAARDVRDTVDPPKGPIEAAGRKIDDATGRNTP